MKPLAGPTFMAKRLSSGSKQPKNFGGTHVRTNSGGSLHKLRQEPATLSKLGSSSMIKRKFANSVTSAPQLPTPETPTIYAHNLKAKGSLIRHARKEAASEMSSERIPSEKRQLEVRRPKEKKSLI